MQNLFEKTASLNEPIECFLFDAANEVFPVKPHWHYFAEVIRVRSGTVAEQFRNAHAVPVEQIEW